MHRIGVDLGGTKIEAIALDGDGREVDRRRVATPAGDYDATIRALVALVADVESHIGGGLSLGARVGASIGIGMPGAIASGGRVKNANSTWLNGRPFAVDVEAALGRPVRVANDANCFALSEAIDGAGAGASTVFGVIVGTGVGGGIVIDGRIHAGRQAIAGEWGHNGLPRVADEDLPLPPCWCGRDGCIETYLSGPAMANDHRAHGGAPIGAVAIAAAASAGDAVARATLARYVRRLGKALASVVNVLDPDVIVLGGGVSNIDALYDAVPRAMAASVFSDTCTTPVVRNRHGDSSGVRGAAWLWPPDRR